MRLCHDNVSVVFVFQERVPVRYIESLRRTLPTGTKDLALFLCIDSIESSIVETTRSFHNGVPSRALSILAWSMVAFDD